MKNATLRLLVPVLFFLAAFSIPAIAGDKYKGPSSHGLNCPVNASVGKKASVQTTHIRKKAVKPKAHKAAPVKQQKQKTVKNAAPKQQKQAAAKPQKVKTEKQKTQKATKVQAQKQSSQKASRPSGGRRGKAIPVYNPGKKSKSKSKSRTVQSVF